MTVPETRGCSSEHDDQSLLQASGQDLSCNRYRLAPLSNSALNLYRGCGPIYTVPYGAGLSEDYL